MELTFIDLHKFRNDLHIKGSSIRFCSSFHSFFTEVSLIYSGITVLVLISFYRVKCRQA